MRLSARRPLAMSAAVAALALGTPALAQTADSYEYAQPAPDGGVIYRSQEVVQGDHAERAAAPLPPEPSMPPVPPVPPMAPPHAMAGHRMPPPVQYAPPPARYAERGYASGVYAPYPPAGYGQAMPAEFDRDGWLADCHDRIRGVDRKERGGVIGGLLGAIAGGVIGNRAWDRHRTAGTLLGAGVGGLAGLAIGSAVGAAGERRHDDECAFYLDQYLTSYPAPQTYPGYGYPGYGYGYGYGGYALVPVLVAVPQHQVIRETVTEEWIDEPVRSRSVPARWHRTAPARTKYIKGN